ncbi:MAG: hypothetical protein Fur0043_23290 [Anaerolineales bacterium]
MKSLIRIVLGSLLLTALLAACTMGASPSPEAQQDAINTAVAGTQMAGDLAQATLNANALTAMPATPTPGPTIEYVTLTEEELAALIDQAVAEAIAASDQTSQAITTTTSDDVMTSEEVEYVYSYYYYADYYIQEAEDLLAAYYDLYADLAYEMIDELGAIETQLEQLNYNMTLVVTSLNEISATLAQGLAVAEESIAQLETAAQQAQANVQELKNQAQDTRAVLQADQQNRLNQLAQIQANNIPTDRVSALQAGFQFVDFANAALADGKMSRDELMNLAQLGANAQAGFQQFGGRTGGVGPGANLDLAQFSGKFNEISTQFARGQMPQARSNLGDFERSLGQRPSGLPGGGGGPNLPGPGNGLPGGGGGPGLPGPGNIRIP